MLIPTPEENLDHIVTLTRGIRSLIIKHLEERPGSEGEAEAFSATAMSVATDIAVAAGIHPDVVARGVREAMKATQRSVQTPITIN